MITATFDAKGMLNPSLSNRHAVPLDCSVPENLHVNNLVTAFEAKRVEMSGVVVAVSAKAVPYVRTVTPSPLDVADGCVELNSTYWCGCRVSQCLTGSVVADAFQAIDFGEQFDSGVDFAVTNAGSFGKIAGLFQHKSGISKEDLQEMLPWLNGIVRLDGVPGSVIRDMLRRSISDLQHKTAYGVEMDPGGFFLQVSSRLKFEWHFEGNEATVGTVQLCNPAANTLESDGPACVDLEDAALYSFATNSYIADGHDGYTMLKNVAGLRRTPGLQSEYVAVQAYLESVQSPSGEPTVIDFADKYHSVKCPSTNMGNAFRVCQTPDHFVLKLGLYCTANENLGDDYTSLQECDTAHHAVEVINNKHDGLYDDLLPYARIELNREHVYASCGNSGKQRAVAQAGWKELNAAFETEGSRSDDAARSNRRRHRREADEEATFYGVVGPECSDSVASITDASWRAANNASQVVISHGSTVTTLADEGKFPNLARLVTSEIGVNVGVAALVKRYQWKRIAIVHEATMWGTDAAYQFERAILDSVADPKLMYTAFAGLNRSTCANGDHPGESSAGEGEEGAHRILRPTDGCDPATAFDPDAMYLAYKGTNCAAGDDACADTCNEANGGFCAERIIEELVKLEAQVVFLAMNPKLQRHFYRAVHINQVFGKGFAFISAWLVETAIRDRAGERIDTDAAQGAEGVLGLMPLTKADENKQGANTRKVPNNPTLFQKYATLWAASSSKSACCVSKLSGAGAGAGDAGSCTRQTAANATDIGGPYCDSDGDGTTSAGYSFQVFDAVLTFAKAMDKGSLFRQPTADTLYQSILDLDVFEGITGDVILDPKSGDRIGNLQVLNVQRTSLNSTSTDATPRSLGTFEVKKIGTFAFGGAATRQLAVDVQVIFPGGETEIPADTLVTTPPSPPPPQQIAMIACLSLLGVVLIAISSHKVYLYIVSLRPVDFHARFEKMLKDGEITEEQLHASGEKTPREIKRKHLEYVQEVGAGQFGSVWKCILDDGGDHPAYTVAAKTVLESTESLEAASNELLAEAAMMAQVGNHPNLVSIVGVITSGMPLVLVLSYCEYGSVLGHVKKKQADGMPISFEGKLQMAIEIACGMEHLAGLHYIHRDLAARNILLGAGRSDDDTRRHSTVGMVCKVADFGR